MPPGVAQRGVRGPYVFLSPENKEYLKERLAGETDQQALEILEKIAHTEDDVMIKMRQPHK